MLCKLESAASIWDRGTTCLADSIESIQNKSARFILNNYNPNRKCHINEKHFASTQSLTSS